MSAPAASAIDRGPGTLIITPTNLATATTYGGTILGATRAHEIDFLDDEILVPGEEFGGATTEALEVQRGCIFYCLMRGFDANALATIFPATSTGSSTGAKVIDGGVQSTVRSGHLRSARAVKLLLAADDPTKRSVLIYKAMPIILPSDRTRFAIFSETTFGIAWHGLPDTANSGRAYKIGKLADLTL